MACSSGKTTRRYVKPGYCTASKDMSCRCISYMRVKPQTCETVSNDHNNYRFNFWDAESGKYCSLDGEVSKVTIQSSKGLNNYSLPTLSSFSIIPPSPPHLLRAKLLISITYPSLSFLLQLLEVRCEIRYLYGYTSPLENLVINKYYT